MPLLGCGRIALGEVVAQVTLEDGGIGRQLGVVVVIDVVVEGGVVLKFLVVGDARSLQFLEVVGVKSALLLIAEAVEADVLEDPFFGLGIKGIGDARNGGDAPPGCFDDLVCGLRIVGRRQAVFEEQAGVFEDVFGDVAEVEVNFALVVFGVLHRTAAAVGIEEGAEHPKLDVLHIGSLKVVGGQIGHDAGPAGFGRFEGAVII